MASLYDFSQAISKLNKEKKFAEALKYFKDGKDEFMPEQIGLNKYIVYRQNNVVRKKNVYLSILFFKKMIKNE